MKIEVDVKISGKGFNHPFGSIVPVLDESAWMEDGAKAQSRRAFFEVFKGEADFKDDGSVDLLIEDENRFFRYELHVEPSSERGKENVSFSFFAPSVRLISAFAENEKCQFSLTKHSPFELAVHTGMLETLKIKNELTKNGGKLRIKFNTIFQGFITNNSMVKFEIIPKGKFLLS